MIYDAEVSTEEEFNCILIYNEEKKVRKKKNVFYCYTLLIFLKKTITLERQSAEIRLTRKKIETPQPNGHLNHSPLPVTYTPTTIHTPPITNTITEPVKEIIAPVSPAVPPTIVTPTITTPAKAAAVVVPEEDEFDLSKDLDEILDSDDEEEEEDNQAMIIDNNQDDDEDSESDQFEEIIAPTPIPPPTSNGVHSPMALPLNTSLPPSPNIPLSLALPGTLTATAVSAATSSASPSSSSAAAMKKRKFKMASAPIRHPGFISPMASGTPPTAAAAPVVQANKRLKLSGTPTTKEAGYSSSSGSEESSSGSESGSTESSSGESESESGSGSSSDDDDFESLAQDISMSLSKGGASAPGSPLNQQQQRSPYKRSPYDMTPGNTPTPSTRPSAPSSSSNGAPGPMSLRALFSKFHFFL